MSSNPRVEQALRDFDAAREAGRTAQAYLVGGNIRDEGIPFAVEAVSRLFCGEKTKPCRACAACRRVAERKHPDVAWLEPEKKSRVMGIEKVRDLNRVVYQTAYEGGWKAAILVGADRLGADAANAFLKTLEEPPARTLFLLLSDAPQSVLPTVLSRCQRLMLSGEQEILSDPWNERLLEVLGKPMQNSVIGRIERGARLEHLFADMRKAVEAEEKRDEDNEDVDSDTLEARIEARYRGLRTMAIRAILLWYRDILVCVCGGDDALLRFRGKADAVRQAAGGLSYGAALANIRTVELMQRQLDRNLAEGTVIHGAVNALAV